MKKFRVTVGLCQESDIAKMWFESLEASTPSEIRRAIIRLSSKKIVRRMIDRVQDEKR